MTSTMASWGVGKSTACVSLVLIIKEPESGVGTSCASIITEAGPFEPCDSRLEGADESS